MKWILIYLFYTGTEMKLEEVNTFDSMADCFMTRENLAVDLGSVNGYYPVNHQAICVRVE